MPRNDNKLKKQLQKALLTVLQSKKRHSGRCQSVNAFYSIRPKIIWQVRVTFLNFIGQPDLLTPLQIHFASPLHRLNQCSPSAFR